MTIRARLTLTYVALLVGVMSLVLGASWLLLEGQLARTVPAPYAGEVAGRLGGQFLLALGGATLLALGLGWAAAGSALRPLRRIAATAGRITDARLEERTGLGDGPDDEVRELAVAFDAMLDRVAGSVAAQQRFVANASHELRTPLTVIRTGAEVVLDDPDASVEDLRAVAREAVETTERTEELLEGLLTLAAVGAVRPERLGREPVDLGVVAGRAVAAAQASAGGDRVEARLAGVRLRGDAALLERLAGNLVENAIRHGDGGPVLVEVGGDPGGARLRVRNGGAVLDPAGVERMAEPFERLGRRRSGGAGLGLSIVRAVAEAHGGRLTLTARPAGGLDATVLLPTAG
ncbi:MAG: HAMP domain-containing histidine kinase [Solirubrobacterales bacterium]|nr:HAMP domain-containing histidine kinase [Solirubrobacterales bacterium]